MEYAVLTQFYQYETKRISTNSSVYFKTSSNAANKVYSVLLFCLCNVCLFVCLFVFLRSCQTCVRADRRGIGFVSINSSLLCPPTLVCLLKH